MPQVEYEMVDLTADTMIMSLDISAAIKATEGLKITPIPGDCFNTIYHFVTTPYMEVYIL